MKKINQQLIRLFSRMPVPVLLLFACILAYGLLVPWLGFYLDDWYIVLYQKVFGPNDFTMFFKGDRPLFAYIYQIFVPIFRDSKLGWQLFAVFSHALAAITFWWLLVKVIPTRRKLVFVAAIFFAIYPGFKFHWFAVMYSQAYILYTIYFLSYILMIKAVKMERGKVWFSIAALICLIVGIVPSEDLFGLELIRPIILYIVLHNSTDSFRKNLKSTMLKWIPYLVIGLGFTVYRVGFGSKFGYEISLLDELQSYPLHTTLRIFGEVFWSTLDVLINAWTSTLQILNRNMLSAFSIAMLLLILFSVFLSLILLKKFEKTESNTQNNNSIIIIGLLATIASMIPFVVGSFKINLDFPNNRYLYAMAPGASLFLAGIIDSLFRSDKQKSIVISLLIGFAIGSQFLVARSFMLSWRAQQDFFWQLSWRVPDMQPDTILITEDLPFSKYYSSSSLMGPLNLTYAKGLNSNEIPYLFIVESQQGAIIPELKPDRPINYNFRSFSFQGNTSSMLLFYQPQVGCFRIISPSDSPIEFIYSLRYGFWYSAIPLSNLDRIIVDPEKAIVPPKEYFGVENRNHWCYFYEKADLARQQQKWDEIIGLYDKANNEGFKPLTDSEWLPLIEALINVKDAKRAIEITKSIKDFDQTNTAGFCSLWSKQIDNNENQLFAADAISFLKCKK